ncbi:MAG: aminotransferase class V-fold PLP-dependent enzyme [Thermoanaerobaculia bacterium]
MISSALPLGFGHAIRGDWPLDPEIAYLNHGTVGVTPVAVLDTQEAIRREIERNPSAHLLRDISGMIGADGPGRLRQAAAEVARFVGSEPDDLVFVGNATEGANAVLRSFGLTSDDAVLTTEKTYGGVDRAVRYTCRETGAEVVVATVPCPIEEPGQFIAEVEHSLSPQTRLAVLDHIISETGVLLPVRELAEICHARGVRVLVDGAHAPGQIELNVPGLGVDYYTANLHKWACAPRSCGFLWVAPEHQKSVHPTVISWGLDEGFTHEFDWIGTRDTSPWLAAPAGIRYLEALGFDSVAGYNHDLVWRATELMTERWRGFAAAGPEMSAFMTSVQLPSSLTADSASAETLRTALLEQHRIEVPVFAWHDRLWLRLSAQVYNEFEEFERLADVIDALPVGA